MQFLFKTDSIPYGFLVIFGFYGLTVQGLKICILALLAPNNLNLWGFYTLRFLKKYRIPSIWHFKGYFRHFNSKNK